MTAPEPLRILITGGTGSLGQALVKHYLKNTNNRLIVYSRDELKQSVMREEFPDGRLDFFLGDIRDSKRLQLACEASVDVVIHAAALKRIDSVCHDPDEVFKTNVLGTRNLLQACRGRVPKCLLISSDKACYPTNAYGLSKAMAESLCTSFNVYSGPKGSFSSVVRYGNVLGSRGSVIPVWSSQVQKRVPLTITDPLMTRFLITMPRAIQMIETALRRMTGGEIFVPRLMAATMEDLATAIAGPSYPRKTVGLRMPGEKMHETLMTDEECERATPMTEADYCIIPVNPPYQGIDPHGWRSDTAPEVSEKNLKKTLLEEALL